MLMVFYQKLKKTKIIMRKIISIFCMSLLISCGSQVSDLELRVAKLETEIASMRKGGGITSVVPAGAYPQFAFHEDGEIVSHVFKFTNTGEAPLVISKATAACGCTVPQWPKQPIPVGGSGEIKVQFDSSNKPGMQNKVVTITANTESKVKKLLIRAQVNPRS